MWTASESRQPWFHEVSAPAVPGGCQTAARRQAQCKVGTPCRPRRRRHGRSRNLVDRRVRCRRAASFPGSSSLQFDTECLTNFAVRPISGEHNGCADVFRSIKGDQNGVDAVVVLLERTQCGAALRYDTKDGERLRQQGFGARLRQNRHRKIRVSVTEFELGQWLPVFVEDDAMDWTGLAQD